MVDDPKVVKFEAPLRYGDVDITTLAERVKRGEIPLEFAERVLAECERVVKHGARLIEAEIKRKEREESGSPIDRPRGPTHAGR
jgi:hypothetical protein